MTSTSAAATGDTGETATGQTGRVPLYQFWQPRYWGIWLGVGVMRCLSLLPFGWQLALGRIVGRVLYRLAPKRREIARVNLQLCFPERDAADIDALLRRHCESLGMTLFELSASWWLSDSKITQLTHLEGLENLTTEMEAGHAIIGVSGHFAGAEIAARAILPHLDAIASMYRPTRNPCMDQIIWRTRHRAATHLIPKGSMRQMLRLLKQSVPVWYAADQSYDRKYSVLVPFFGEPAMTNGALTHIARLSKARVVPFVSRRNDDGTYHALILPALENFPSGDEAADAIRINELLEKFIRQAPEQYYWIHRRFKNRPAPYPDPYADI